jgi:hypothetical protein
MGRLNILMLLKAFFSLFSNRKGLGARAAALVLMCFIYSFKTFAQGDAKAGSILDVNKIHSIALK